jgi:hypothetical protein
VQTTENNHERDEAFMQQEVKSYVLLKENMEQSQVEVNGFKVVFYVCIFVK